MNQQNKLLVFLLVLFSCNPEARFAKSVQKGVNCMQLPFGIEDELIVSNKKERTIYRIEISHDGSFPIKNSELEFSKRELGAKSDTISFGERISFQNEYPYYFINSFKINNKLAYPIVSFYTTQRAYPFGSDPIQVTQWVFFNKKLHKNWGELPMQAEQLSDSCCSLKFDSLLTEKNQELRRICETDWLEFRKKWNQSLIEK